MAIGDAYVDAQDMIDRGLGKAGKDEPSLNRACRSGTKIVNDYCNRHFNTNNTVTTRRFDPTDETIVFVDDFWTTTGLVVKTDDDDDGVFETTWTITTDFELKPIDGIVNGETGFPYWQIWAIGNRTFPNIRRPGVQVASNWGWATVPVDVKEATLIAAEEVWKTREAPFGVAGFGHFGSIRVRENPIFQRLLKDYCRESVRVW